jgi:Collagenase NC10 and Endostatin
MKSTMRFSIAISVGILALGMSAIAPAQQAAMTFFISSVGSGKGGDLGGLEGADTHCQQLAQAAGAGGKTWRAYLSSNQAQKGGAVNARDRIGKGPWQNAKGAVVATSVDDLHSANTKMSRANALNEKGQPIKMRGDTPNEHDILTGSDLEGKAFPGNLNLTCNNWTSSTFGSAMLGHADREGIADTVYQKSWVSSHMSRSCSQPDLVATGGAGLIYCFAQ